LFPHMLLTPAVHKSQLDQARRLLLQGDSLPDDLLPEAVARSWQRSFNAGIHPWDSSLQQRAVKGVALSAEDQRLALCAKDDIDRLWESFGGPSWSLLCVNAGGLIVYSRNDDDSGPLSLLSAGTRIAESDIGTTAPACTLREKEPFALMGCHHYLKEFDRFFCVSVPVYGRNNELAGALDITGIGERNVRVVFEQLRIVAMAIENRLFFQRSEGQQIISLQADQRLLGSPFQGLIALNEKGRITDATHNACQILQLPDDLAMESGLVFDTSRFSSEQVSRLSLTDGSSVYALAATPDNSGLEQPWQGFTPQNFTTTDPVLKQAFQQAGKAFNAGLPVIIHGETGSGKEVFARALHNSRDPSAPFVAVNCSALPESLIEAELFGYSEGTFTGARKGGAAGRIEDADGGTLLLDEIGDMPLSLQTRLLRVLQERSVTRLGSSESRPVNVRVISATHCDLHALVESKNFREDLFYRLKGLEIQLPALRERRDKRQLIDQLLSNAGANRLLEQSYHLLLGYHWPGNIRELENAIKLAVALAGPGEEIGTEHFPGYQSVDSQGSDSEPQTLAQIERQAVQDAVDRHHGNLSAAAAQLGISRTTLYKKLTLPQA